MAPQRIRGAAILNNRLQELTRRIANNARRGQAELYRNHAITAAALRVILEAVDELDDAIEQDLQPMLQRREQRIEHEETQAKLDEHDRDIQALRDEIERLNQIIGDLRKNQFREGKAG
jgi:predicted RNase H-like nuclease (RuvC/YqgF family)